MVFMAQKPLTFEQAKEAAEVWASNNYSRKTSARILKISTSAFINRLDKAVVFGIIPSTQGDYQQKQIIEHKARYEILVNDGIVLVGSDAHYWPNTPSAAHKVFVKMIKELQPKAIIMNGDVFDGSGVSRHPPIGWESRPTVADEIEEVKDRLEDIKLVAPKNCKRIWTLGNHCARFETRIASAAPEYAKIHGVHLKDHFPDWQPCWSTWINNNVVVKHRYKGGVHSTHNNTATAGKTMVCGHTHSLKVTPYSDYLGTRWGVDTGSLAPIYPQNHGVTSPQFLNYTEDNPLNWRSGFAVLTFHKGELLWPELVFIRNQKEYEFRGKVYRV